MTSLPTPALSEQLLHVARAVAAVRGGRSLTEVLGQCPSTMRAGAQALSFLVLRRLGSAQAARSHLASRPPPPEVEALLLCALALLWPPAGAHESAPYTDHTLVNQTVAAVKQVHPPSSAFANAVLRRFVREREGLVPLLMRQSVVRTNHPEWWVQQLEHDWPQHWSALIKANNEHAPMTLRVNARRASALEYVAKLKNAGLQGHPVEHPLLTQAVVLEHPVPVTQLPGFAQGDVSVQDLAAQLAAPLLLHAGHLRAPLAPGARVLDACAAPGGKTAHLLEAAALEVWAVDSDADRLGRVRQTLERMGLQAHTVAADASQTKAWWDGQRFDAILLDAPCSASGVVRRHPDIRWLRRPNDLEAFSRIQQRLLRALWPLLKPQGRMLFVTCSVFRCEGPLVVDTFLRENLDAHRVEGLQSAWLPGLLPNDPQASPGDGFFYTLLEKRGD